MSIEQTSADFGRLQHQLGEIAQAWWTEWLRIFGRVRPALFPEPALPTVSLSGHEILVQGADGSQTRLDGADRRDGESPISSLRALLGDKADIAIRLAPIEVLRTNLKLPKAAPRILKQALQFELARLSPVDPAQLYFDYEIDASRERSEVEIHVRMVRRAALDRAITLCQALGLGVAAILFGDDPRPAQWRAVPIDRSAYVRTVWRRWGIASLCGAAAVLAGLVLLAAYARGQASLDDLESRIEAVRGQARLVEQLKEEMQETGNQQSFLTARKQEPLLSATLSELSRILPDDTWVAALQTTGSKIRIQGYSKSASHLLGRLDASRNFANAQFQAPLTRDGNGDSERFDLTLEVRR